MMFCKLRYCHTPGIVSGLFIFLARVAKPYHMPRHHRIVCCLRVRSKNKTRCPAYPDCGTKKQSFAPNLVKAVDNDFCARKLQERFFIVSTCAGVHGQTMFPDAFPLSKSKRL